jgi:hypothetical protein
MTERRFDRSPCLYVAALLLGAAASWSLAVDFPNPDAADLPPRTVMQYPPPREIPEWLQTHVRIGHLPGYNERMVSEFLKAGYNVVTVNCMDAWYRVGPSASLYTPEQASQANAYLRKVVDTIHAAGAKSVWYIGPVQVPWLSRELCKAHPDWLRINPDGRPDAQPNFANIRSGYAEWLCNQLAYVTRQYKPDGFWFDGYAPVHLHTYDEKTRKLFREYSGGHEIPHRDRLDPVHDPVSRRYLAWHEQYFVDLADRIRGIIRKENPSAVIFANNSGNRTWYYPEMTMSEYPAAYSGAVDVSSVELYWDVPGDALYQQFCYAFMQAVTRGRGASVWIQPQLHGISGVASPIDIQLRGLEGLPWGVTPEFVESALREEYLKLHVENMKVRERWLVRSESVPYIGIVASEQTRTLFAQAALPAYFSHTLGAFRSVFEKHWPVRILTEYDLEDAKLQGVRVLVLASVACLSERSAEVIRRFVKTGGGLVATFETSLYGSDFKRRGDFSLGDLFHAKYVKTHPVNMRSENLYLTLDANHPIVSDPAVKAKQATAWQGGPNPPPDKGNLAMIAGAAQVEPLQGAETLSTYILNQPEQQNARYPAIVVSTYGKGRVVYFPVGIDKAMFFYPDSYMRQMLANACLWAAQEKPPLQVDGPLILATTFRRQPAERRLIIHLLNDHSSYGRHSIYQKLVPLPEELRKKWGLPAESEMRATWPIREETIPLHDIKVICRVPGVTKATLQPENIDLPLSRTAEGTEVTVPTVVMHSMVVFQQGD